CILLAVWFWFPVTKFTIIASLFYSIYQSVMALLSCISCLLVFAGIHTNKPGLLLSAVIQQVIITISFFVTFTIFLTWIFALYDVWGMM
ncbi:hypothetical protein PMAYCL1PPCAC_31503, partial [Pristionchus mayeri]